MPEWTVSVDDGAYAIGVRPRPSAGLVYWIAKVSMPDCHTPVGLAAIAPACAGQGTLGGVTHVELRWHPTLRSFALFVYSYHDPGDLSDYDMGSWEESDIVWQTDWGNEDHIERFWKASV